MFYIGLDQSSKVIGYAVINDNNELLDYGIYKVPDTKDLMKRIEYIFNDFLNPLIEKYSSDFIIGLEDTQESRMNTNTFQLLTKVLGAIEYFLYSKNIDYRVCHVSSWRGYSNIKGKKRQEKKENAIKKVEEKYGLKVEEDAAEAVLIALYLKNICT